jgi:hypothetical protein
VSAPREANEDIGGGATDACDRVEESANDLSGSHVRETSGLSREHSVDLRGDDGHEGVEVDVQGDG